MRVSPYQKATKATKADFYVGGRSYMLRNATPRHTTWSGLFALAIRIQHMERHLSIGLSGLSSSTAGDKPRRRNPASGEI
jgi:hypothetical protein